MKVRLDDIHSPCRMCFLKGIFYDPNSICCQRCEYNIAIKLLKRVLKKNDHCTFCNKHGICAVTDAENNCKQGENLIINWEAVCNEYKIEYDK